MVIYCISVTPYQTAQVATVSDCSNTYQPLEFQTQATIFLVYARRLYAPDYTWTAPWFSKLFRPTAN